MFHFMRKEKSEEERAEKEERKRRKKEQKERKKRESLTSEDLTRLEEVRKSLRIKVRELGCVPKCTYFLIIVSKLGPLKMLKYFCIYFRMCESTRTIFFYTNSSAKLKQKSKNL